MSSVSTNLNAYTQYGSAYARAAATQPSLANALASNETPSNPASTSATNLTLSDAAKAKFAASASTTQDFSAVTAEARSALDSLYRAVNAAGPLDADGKPTISLSSQDRRSLFAIATNSAGKFSAAEQRLAASALGDRFSAALAAPTATAQLTGDFSGIYQAALTYLDAASGEEKATASWAAQRAAVATGVQATQQDPTKAPSGIANDPVAIYLASDSAGTTPVKDFSSVAKDVRATLDAQAKAASAVGKELVYDARRATGQMADLSAIDNRSLSAMSLNQDGLFAPDESFAAKQELGSRNRASILSALKQSQSSGDPTKLSLGILNAYSAMSNEERQASNWTPAFRDNAVQSYKTTSSLLSMLKSG